jgi:hypothetical protein
MSGDRSQAGKLGTFETQKKKKDETRKHERYGKHEIRIRDFCFVSSHFSY